MRSRTTRRCTKRSSRRYQCIHSTAWTSATQDLGKAPIQHRTADTEQPAAHRLTAGRRSFGKASVPQRQLRRVKTTKNTRCSASVSLLLCWVPTRPTAGGHLSDLGSRGDLATLAWTIDLARASPLPRCQPIPAAVTGVKLTKSQTGASGKWNICPAQFDRSIGILHVSGAREPTVAAEHERP